MKSIKIKKLAKSYDGKTKVLDDVSFSIEQGEVFGFLGPNGSGKTTTIRILNGILKKTSGYAEICGIPLEENNIKIHRLCGVMTESSALYGNFTAEENIRFFGRMHEMEEHIIEKRMELILKRLNLWNVKNKKVKDFSTGMKKRVSLAVALIHNPEILFLDEPTSGLDPENALNVTHIIKELSAENNVTVFICTHQLKYAKEICTKYGFINKGHILGVGSFDELAAKKGADLKLQIRGMNIPDGLGFQYDKKGMYTRNISEDKDAGKIIKKIIQEGGEIYEAVQRRWSLEDLYFKYMSEVEYHE